jgi:phospholipase C
MFLLFVLLAAGAAVVQSATVKHVVVLELENRSFDHLFGWLGIGNGLTGKEFNRVLPGDPLSKKIFVDRNASMVAPCDPNHGFQETALKEFGAFRVGLGETNTTPSMAHFVEVEAALHLGHETEYCAVMKCQDPSRLTVSTWLAKNFALFDRWFSSVAGPTWPNR